ncbi:MAG: CARDB domain-containing protein [Pseudomonadota bacterium]
MTTFITNTIRSALTASVILAGFAATVDAAELRKKQSRGHQQAIGGLTTGTSKGGTGNFPDLIVFASNAITNGLPGTGFCGAWNGGNPSLNIVVGNVGNVQAGQSQLSVQFSNGSIDNVNVPALNSGQNAVINVPIPGSAWTAPFHGHVQFDITANSTNVVPEGNLSNNTESSICIGPAT